MTLNKYSLGEKERRPWGEWEVICCEPSYIVKKITVNPGHRLSTQYHKYRSELWMVVAGGARALIGENWIDLPSGASAKLPVGMHHAIENQSSNILIFVEVQMGEILDEADIVRLEDKYGRL